MTQPPKELWHELYRAGLYTKGYDQFVEQYGAPDKLEKLRASMFSNGHTKAKNTKELVDEFSPKPAMQTKTFGDRDKEEAPKPEEVKDPYVKPVPKTTEMVIPEEDPKVEAPKDVETPQKAEPAYWTPANINGKEANIPLDVPWLSKPEKEHLAFGLPPTDIMLQKAAEFAATRPPKNIDKPWQYDLWDGLRIGSRYFASATAATAGELANMSVHGGGASNPSYMLIQQARAKGIDIGPGAAMYRMAADQKDKANAISAQADAKSAFNFIGQILPYTAGTVAAILTAPVSGTAAATIGVGNLAVLGAASFGSGLQAYDEYKAEKGDDNIDPLARISVGALYGTAEFFFEKYALSKFLPKNAKGKMGEILFGGAPGEIVEKAAKDLLDEFAKKNASNAQLVKNVMREAGKGALVEGETEAATELAQKLADFIYLESEDYGDHMSTLAKDAGMAFLGGAIMGAGMGPLSYGSQHIINKQRREKNGKVVITQNKETGEAVEVLGISEGGKDQPLVYSVVRPNGKTETLSEDKAGQIVTLTPQQFDLLLKGKFDARAIEASMTDPNVPNMVAYGDNLPPVQIGETVLDQDGVELTVTGQSEDGWIVESEDGEQSIITDEDLQRIRKRPEVLKQETADVPDGAEELRNIFSPGDNMYRDATIGELLENVTDEWEQIGVRNTHTEEIRKAIADGDMLKHIKAGDITEERARQIADSVGLLPEFESMFPKKAEKTEKVNRKDLVAEEGQLKTEIEGIINDIKQLTDELKGIPPGERAAVQKNIDDLKARRQEITNRLADIALDKYIPEVAEMTKPPEPKAEPKAEADADEQAMLEKISPASDGDKIKLDPDLANIDPTIQAARNGDKQAQKKLEEYGLDWEQTTTYRFVGQSEVDVLLSNNKVESKRFTDAGIDVTTSDKVTSAASNEYRVTFKESFDVNNGLGKVKIKSKEEGDHNLEKGRGYDINDVAKIERIDENGNVIEVVYEQSLKAEPKAEPKSETYRVGDGNSTITITATPIDIEGIEHLDTAVGKKSDGDMTWQVIEIVTGGVIAEGFSREEAIDNAKNDPALKKIDYEKVDNKIFQGQYGGKGVRKLNESEKYNKFLAEKKANREATPLLYTPEEIEKITTLAERLPGDKDFLLKQLDRRQGEGIKISIEFVEKKANGDFDKEVKMPAYVEDDDTKLLSVDQRKARALSKAKNVFEKQKAAIENSPELFKAERIQELESSYAERVKQLEERYSKLGTANVVAEIKSKNLTHVSGLGMGANQALGTYISTEKGNRYGEGKKVEVDIENPFISTDDPGFVETRMQAVRDNIDQFTPEDFVDENLLPATVVPKNPTIDNMSGKGMRKTAAIITKNLQDQGYDSIYFPESDTQEGELIVFDRSKVKGLEAKPAEPKKEVAETRSVKVRQGEYDVDFDSDGNIIEIRTKAGKVIEQYIMRRKKGRLDDMGAKRVGNPIYSQIANEALGIEEGEDAVVDRLYNEAERNAEFEGVRDPWTLALREIARGGKISRESIAEQFSTKSEVNQGYYMWLHGMGKAEDVESMADRIAEEADTENGQEIRDALIDIMQSFTNRRDVRKALIQNKLDEIRIVREYDEMEAALGLEIIDDLLEMPEQERNTIIEQDFNESFDALPKEEQDFLLNLWNNEQNEGQEAINNRAEELGAEGVQGVEKEDGGKIQSAESASQEALKAAADLRKQEELLGRMEVEAATPQGEMFAQPKQEGMFNDFGKEDLPARVMAQRQKVEEARREAGRLREAADKAAQQDQVQKEREKAIAEGQIEIPNAKQKRVEKKKILDEEGKAALDDFMAEFDENLGIIAPDPKAQLEKEARIIAKGSAVVNAYIKKGVFKLEDMLLDLYEQLGDKLSVVLDAIKKAYGAHAETVSDDIADQMDERKVTRAITFETIKAKADVLRREDDVDADLGVRDQVGTGEEVVSGTEPRGSVGSGIQGSPQTGGLFGSDNAISGSVSATDRAISNSGFSGRSSGIQPGFSGSTHGPGGSGILDDAGVPSKQEATGGVKAVAPNSTIEEKIALQKKAESIKVIPGDADNISQTLPLLRDVQLSNVFKAEKRFAVGKGFLIGDRTGVGKGLSGLGVIKRMVKQGKGRIIIVVPGDEKIKDWINEGSWLGLSISELKNTKDSGSGVVITTYANYGANEAVTNDDWDMVVYDEAHWLQTNEKGTDTARFEKHRRMANLPSSVWQRMNNKYRDLLNHPDSSVRYEARQRALAEGKELTEKTKVLYLSATPFARITNLKIGDGALFDITETWGRIESGQSATSAWNDFMVKTFGYRIRYSKLTIPESGVDMGLMERQFADRLTTAGAKTATALESDQDYSREFVLLANQVGSRIDEGLRILTTEFRGMNKLVRRKFNYLYTTRLLEAIKAKEMVPRIRKHMDMGRQIVLFHNYNEGVPSHPFDFSEEIHQLAQSEEEPDIFISNMEARVREFNQKYPEFSRLPMQGLMNPIATMTAAFGPAVGFYNGQPHTKKIRGKNIEKFTAGTLPILVIQIKAGKEGINLQDKKGDRQRVLINLGLPTAPTDAIQSEGRIIRFGAKSHGILEYGKLGFAYETRAFAEKVSERSQTAENLNLGSQARGLDLAFREGFMNPSNSDPNTEQGVGGKEADIRLETSDTFDLAKTIYWGKSKRNAATKSQEGVDYFATPEPIGLKMVDFLHLQPNEKALEPSAGDGAIARWMPHFTTNVAIEPSYHLSVEVAVTAETATVLDIPFEEHNIVNKYDGIAMNPPFGTAGKMAMEHLDKAFKHLREGGRIVAIVPTGKMNDRLTEWLKDNPSAQLKSRLLLPGTTFKRAGTGVYTQMLVIDKDNSGTEEQYIAEAEDMTDMEDINDLFDAFKEMNMAPRPQAPVSRRPLAALTQDRGAIIGEKKDGSQNYENVDTKHTATGADLFVTKITKTLGKDEYLAVSKKAKDHGGYYSRFTKGFNFQTAEQRQKFVDEVFNGAQFSMPDVVNGFYSPLEKIISESKQDKMPAKQWIEKFAKGEEAKWTGLTDWLNEQTGSVSKEDIQKYLKENRTELRESVSDGLPMFQQGASGEFSALAQEAINRAQKAFPNVIVTTDVAAIDEAKALMTAAGKMERGAMPLGFVLNGKVYIDPRVATVETPMHEFGHIWNTWVKLNDNKLFMKGLALVKGSAYEARVRANKGYDGLSEMEILEEALALAIGERGAELMKDSKFKRWLKDLWASIKNMFGIDVRPMTLAEFVDKAAKDITGGKQINITSEQIAEAQSRVQPMYLEEQSVMSLLGDTANATQAKSMELTGMSMRQIEAATGWHRGQDGKWRRFLTTQHINNEKGAKVDRLSRAEEAGRSRGGEIHVEASVIAGRVHQAIGSNTRTKGEIIGVEEEYLELYAREKGVWVENTDKTYGKPDDNGQEQKVFFTGDGYVTKLNNGALNESALDLMDRIALHNYHFPGTAYEVIGFGKEADGTFVTILKQPHIVGSKATNQQVVDDMAKRGFVSQKTIEPDLGPKEAAENFVNPDLGIVIEDVHLGNVISKNGKLYYIDPIVGLFTPEKGGTRTPTQPLGPTRLIRKPKAGDTLGDVMDIPHIYELYPEAKNIPIKVDPEAGYAAGYDFKSIILGRPDSEFLEQHILHEVQHYVQHQEGLIQPDNIMDLDAAEQTLWNGLGGKPDMWRDYSDSELLYAMEELHADMVKRNDPKRALAYMLISTMKTGPTKAYESQYAEVSAQAAVAGYFDKEGIYDMLDTLEVNEADMWWYKSALDRKSTDMESTKPVQENPEIVKTIANMGYANIERMEKEAYLKSPAHDAMVLLALDAIQFDDAQTVQRFAVLTGQPLGTNLGLSFNQAMASLQIKADPWRAQMAMSTSQVYREALIDEKFGIDRLLGDIHKEFGTQTSFTQAKKALYKSAAEQVATEAIEKVIGPTRQSLTSGIRTAFKKGQHSSARVAPLTDKSGTIAYELELIGKDLNDLGLFAAAMHGSNRNARVAEMRAKAKERVLEHLSNKIDEAVGFGKTRKADYARKLVEDVINDNYVPSTVPRRYSDLVLKEDGMATQSNNVENGSGRYDSEWLTIIDRFHNDNSFDDMRAILKKTTDLLRVGRLDMMLASGIINQRNYDALLNGTKEGYASVLEDYVPLTVRDDMFGIDDDSGGGGTGVHGLVGTEKYDVTERNNPIATMMMQYVATARQVAKNDFIAEVAGQVADANKEAAEIGKGSFIKLNSTSSNRQAGTVDEQGRLVFNPGKDAIAENSVKYYVNGKVRYMTFPRIVDKYGKPRKHPVVTAFESEDLPSWFDSTFIKAYMAIFNLRRMLLTQMNPWFALRNVPRDNQARFLHMAIFKEVGMWETIMQEVKHIGPLGVIGGLAFKNKSIQAAMLRYERAGGKMTWANAGKIGQDITDMQTLIDSYYQGPVGGKRSAKYGNIDAAAMATKVLDLTGNFNDAMENSTRLSVFMAVERALLEKGYTQERAVTYAANVAKNITVNFEQKGKAMKYLGMWKMFLNVAVQGVDMSWRSLRSGRAAVPIAVIAMASALNRAVLYYDSEDDPEENEEMMLQIYNGVDERSILVATLGKTPFRIPKGYGITRIPITVGENVVDMMMGYKTPGYAMMSLIGSLGQTFIPVIGELESKKALLFPSLVEPIGAAWLNTAWYDKDIQPMFGMSVLETDEDGDETKRRPWRTSEVHKKFTAPWALGFSEALEKYSRVEGEQGVFDWSPDKIEYMYKQYTAGAVKESIDAIVEMQNFYEKGLDGVDLQKFPLTKTFGGKMRDDDKTKFYSILRLISEDATSAITPKHAAFIKNNLEYLKEKKFMTNKQKKSFENQLKLKYAAFRS